MAMGGRFIEPVEHGKKMRLFGSQGHFRRPPNREPGVLIACKFSNIEEEVFLNMKLNFAQSFRCAALRNAWPPTAPSPCLTTWALLQDGRGVGYSKAWNMI